MLSSIRAMAGRALIVAISAALGLSTVAAGAASTLDELIELNLRAWSGEPELLSETYAPDGVHAATFYDRTNEYVGPQAIEEYNRRTRKFGGLVWSGVKRMFRWRGVSGVARWESPHHSNPSGGST